LSDPWHVGNNKEVDEQKGAEAEVESFRKTRPFVVAAETTRMAMVFTDATEPDNPIIFANELSLLNRVRPRRCSAKLQFLMAHVPMLRRWRGSRPNSRVRQPAARRFSTAEGWKRILVCGLHQSSSRSGGNIIHYFASLLILPT